MAKARTLNLPTLALHLALAGVLGLTAFARHASADALGLPGTAATAELPLDPFTGLPDPRPARFKPRTDPGRVFPGTDGLALPAPARLRTGAATVAILGDLAPDYPTGAGDKYLKMAVDELNLLRPDLVLTVGNLVPGLTRDGARYAADVARTRTTLDALDMPWYPCPGERDLLSGTRQPTDRRAQALFQKYQGPLYYSLDTGDLHVIVLNTEEPLDPGVIARGIGEGQLRWLRADLNRVFEGAAGSRARWIIVAMHRPLWRDAARAAATGWQRAQELFVDFNRRPIVRVEGGRGFGADAGASALPAPRVVALVAGGQRAYALDSAPVPTDGLYRFVLGPSAAMPRAGEDAVAAVRGMLLLKLEADDLGGVHPALVALGAEGPADGQLVMPADVITGAEREMIDAIAGWGDDVFGIDGFIDERSGIQREKGLRMRISNPLSTKIDMALRTAGTRFLTGSRRELANTYAEGFDLPWEMTSRHMLRQLSPGETYGWDMGFSRAETGAALDASPPAPPQVDLLVHWADARGRTHEVTLKRRVPLAARVQLPVVTAAREETFWNDAAAAGKVAAGSAYAYEIRGDEPRKLNPAWQMAADGERVYFKIRVDDPVASFWPRMALDPAWGGIASDAVSLAWAPDEHAAPADVQRVWAFPSGRGPGGIELWTNTGVGDRQTDLLKLDPASGITAAVRREEGKGYELSLSLPRKRLFAATRPATAPATSTAPTVFSSAVMNIAVYDNDQSARTWVRTWAKESLGPAGWGKVEIVALPGNSK
jgi:hypothetical protein